MSLFEALLVREAVAALCPSLGGSGHLGNKGWEAFLSTLRLEGAKQLTTIVGLVLVAVILVVLGLQATGG